MIIKDIRDKATGEEETALIEDKPNSKRLNIDTTHTNQTSKAGFENMSALNKSIDAIDLDSKSNVKVSRPETNIFEEQKKASAQQSDDIIEELGDLEVLDEELEDEAELENETTRLANYTNIQHSKKPSFHQAKAAEDVDISSFFGVSGQPNNDNHKTEKVSSSK